MKAAAVWQQKEAVAVTKGGGIAVTVWQQKVVVTIAVSEGGGVAAMAVRGVGSGSRSSGGPPQGILWSVVN
jgi:hypothetical protein